MPTQLSELLQSLYGVQTSYEINPTVSQVETALTKVLSYDPNRFGVVLVNTGSATIYLSPENSVAVGQGIALLPNGGAMVLEWDKDFELCSYEWYAIADGAASSIYLLAVRSY